MCCPELVKPAERHTALSHCPGRHWTLFLVCFVVLGICRTFKGGLQSEQQCPYWLAGDRGGHCYSHRHQPGDAEEAAVRHHQPWDRGGEDPPRLMRARAALSVGGMPRAETVVTQRSGLSECWARCCCPSYQSLGY